MSTIISWFQNHFTFHADINLDTYFFVGLMNVVFLAISRGLLNYMKKNNSDYVKDAYGGVAIIITMIQWWIGNHRHELTEPEVKTSELKK